jgi:hypothetical protein
MELDMANGKKRVHYYHAEAGVLRAQLQRPLQQEIKPQAFVKLHDKPGYLSERAENYRLEGIISFKSAYTHVSGHESLKEHKRWVTLSTSVVEGLNIFEVVTADRIVGQISTEHPRDEEVPHVTFLGTRFENLKIAGHEVHTTLNLNICGPKPADDALYVEDQAFLNNASKHQERVSRANFSGDMHSKYAVNLPALADLREQWNVYLKDESGAVKKPEAAVETSLVTELRVDGWKSGGHVIEVPEFGRIFLAELRVDCNSFSLAMLRFEMGCVGNGNGTAGTNVVNGGGKTGGG